MAKQQQIKKTPRKPGGGGDAPVNPTTGKPMKY